MGVKAFIKKIPFVYPVINKIRLYKNLRYPKLSEKYISHVAKVKRHGKIKVGFIVQLSESCWDKQVDVFNEMILHSDFSVKLLVVPKNINGEFETYEDNYFFTNYPNYCIKVIENNKVINIKKLNFDYIFFPRPYDYYLPKGIRSTDLVKFTRCCYIPYGFSLSDNFNDCNVDSSFFDNIYIEFTESEYICSLLYKKYKNSCDKNIRHFEYLGYPCLNKYLDMKPNPTVKTITWTPRWSYDIKYGGSNFVEYKDSFINFCRNLPKTIDVIFRPHPLMFDELIKKNIITQKEKDNFLYILEELNIQMDVKSPIDVILNKTDILITDFSSIILQFFLTNRPIIYCKKNIDFNETGKIIEKGMYVTTTWDEVEKKCNLLINGIDELSYERENIIKREFSNLGNSAKNIVKRIFDDYRGDNI